MKNSSEIVGLSFLDRLTGKIRNYSEVFSYLGVGVLSFLLSNSVLFAQIAPFGAALTAAVGGDYTLAAVLGAVAGYLVAPALEFKMKYIVCILVIGAVKWALAGKLARFSPILSPLLAGVVLGGTGMALLAYRGVSAYDLVLLFSELLLAAGAAFFFSRTLGVLQRDDLTPLKQSDLSCIVITFGLTIVALCAFSISDVCIGRIAAVLVILICALKAGESGGAIGGITAGVAVCLSDSTYAFLMGAYGFGGLIAGIFGQFGRFGCAAAFIVTNGIANALATLVMPTTLAPVIEVFIASVIFVLLPGSFLRKLGFSEVAKQSMSADSVKNVILNRLYFTKKALGEVSSITRQVSGKLQKLDKPPFDINAAAADRVCKRCPQKLTCWQENFNTTSAALNDMAGLLRRGQNLNIHDIPEPLLLVCKNPQGLLGALTDCYNEQRQQEIGFTKTVQLRSVVLDQWSGIEQLISDIAADVSRIAVQNEHMAGRIRDYLGRRSIPYGALSCYENKDNRVVIELTTPAAVFRNLDKTELSFDFSEICDRDLALPETAEREGDVLMLFYEHPAYKLCYGVAQICSTGKRLCGDSFKFIQEAGTSMAILSDGMGSGSLAAIDSSMATALISRLAAANVGLEATLKLVNSAMLIKSGDESLATVDICQANLYKGSVTLYKAGAAPSYLRKNGRVGFVESASLPAGILNSIEFEETTLLLCAGDMVLMVSDGVTQTGEDWVLDELERFEGTDMQSLCDRIATQAKSRRTETHDDDITVFAMLLQDAV